MVVVREDGRGEVSRLFLQGVRPALYPLLMSDGRVAVRPDQGVQIWDYGTGTQAWEALGGHATAAAPLRDLNEGRQLAVWGLLRGHRDAGDLDGARRDVALSPGGHSQFLANIAAWNAREGRYDAAVAVAEAMPRGGLGLRAGAFCNIVKHQALRGDLALATATMKAYVKGAPNRYIATVHIVVGHARLGELAKASALTRRVRKPVNAALLRLAMVNTVLRVPEEQLSAFG